MTLILAGCSSSGQVTIPTASATPSVQQPALTVTFGNEIVTPDQIMSIANTISKMPHVTSAAKLPSSAKIQVTIASCADEQSVATAIASLPNVTVTKDPACGR